MIRPPRGLLVDYGGTLVEELAFDRRAGIEVMLTHASYSLGRVDRDAILARADRITREVADRREVVPLETPWPSLTRLIYDYFGIRFDAPLADLELAFWDAAAKTRPMPGVRDALVEFRRAGLPMGVVSNSSFGHNIIRHELAKHGLAEFLPVMVSSAEYVVRKPNPLLFETAAGLLGTAPADVWFVGDRLDTDMAGARAAGMTPIWFAPSGDTPRGDAEIAVSTWSNLAAIFRNGVRVD